MSGAAGLIVNPAAGRDIRRLVASASLMANREKVAIARRVLIGLRAVGTHTVWVLDDDAGLVRAAAGTIDGDLEVRSLPVTITGTAADSTEAARAAAAAGVGCIVTLGGDGTNRAVALGCGDVPLMAISTGTNNVFPSMVEGTVAGMAAGLVATGAVPREIACRSCKRVEVEVDGHTDIALIDAAVTREHFVGSRAIWDPGQVAALVLANALPWAVGLSAIGGRLRPIDPEEKSGLHVELGGERTVRVPVAPGLIADVPVRDWRVLELGEEIVLPPTGGTLALDGEREIAHRGPGVARVTDSGPIVIDIPATMAATSGLW